MLACVVLEEEIFPVFFLLYSMLAFSFICIAVVTMYTFPVNGIAFVDLWDDTWSW